jgi:isopenicillin N synthase-like dioxygenase
MGVGTPTPSSNDRIPVIDLSMFRRSPGEIDSGRRAGMLERLAEACRTCGVFYAENHGIPEEVLQRAMSQFDAFFDLPLDERMEIAAPPGQACGYEPLDVQVREWNDSFHCVFGMKEFPDLDALMNTGPNRWPRRPAGLEATARETMRALHRVGADVMSSLALSLGLSADHFDPVIGESNDAGSMRARRYPARQGHEGRIGTNSHVDGPPLALIVQNEVPGLETEIPGIGWAVIEPRPGTIVCQLGSLFKLWTNDRYVPNRHRVVNDDPSRERRSLIYWFPIHPDATIACLPTCCGADDPPRHEPIRYTRYLAEWVRKFAEEV